MARARYWIGTIPKSSGWTVPSSLPDACNWIRGQEELGEGGFEHFQVFVGFRRDVRLRTVRDMFPGHWEPSRSKAAEDYVWKEATRIPESQFELGSKPFKRNSATDWDAVRSAAVSGKLEDIPSDVYVRHYSALRRICADHARPVAQVRTCYVFWGKTGSGKSKRAWEEAGLEAYSKDPLTKWWCGYRGEGNVVIDEFRGVLSVAHLLRWLDRYPVRVEGKGTTYPLLAVNFWITSNLDPRSWYPEVDDETRDALLRRLNITHFSYFFPNFSNMSAERRVTRSGRQYSASPYLPVHRGMFNTPSPTASRMSSLLHAASDISRIASNSARAYRYFRGSGGRAEQSNNRTSSNRRAGSKVGNQDVGASGGYTGKKVKYKKRKLTKGQKIKRKKWKKFKTKVNKVIDKSKAYGYHNIVGSTHLFQDTINKWNVQYQSTGTGTDLFSFFQPAQFKDAEAVCFNSKAPAIDGYKTTNVTATGNFDTNNITHVIDSSVSWKFVNASQHPSYVEMYICSAKLGSRYSFIDSIPRVVTAKRPDELWADTGVSLTTRGELNASPSEDLTSCLAQAKLMLSSFDVRLVKFKLEPGQTQTHFMQGPKNYRMDGSKKVAPHSLADKTTPTWRNWSSPNCGVIVFFRTLNELTLGGDGKPSHFPHKLDADPKGGIACSYTQYFKMRAPNTDSTLGSDEISNTIVGVNAMQNSTGTDIEIDPSNPTSNAVPGL